MKFACITLALLLIMTGFIFLSASNKPVSGRPENVANVSYSAMKEGDIYYVEELLLYERFARMGNDQVVYMLVSFPDKEGGLITATMAFNKKSAYWDEVNAYVANPEHTPGELTLDCYVSLARDTAPDNATYGEAYVESYVQAYNAFKSKMLLQHGPDLDIQRSSWQLSYICDAGGDPYAGNKGTNTVTKLLSAACFVASTLVLYFGVLHKPKQTPTQNG